VGNGDIYFGGMKKVEQEKIVHNELSLVYKKGDTLTIGQAKLRNIF